MDTVFFPRAQADPSDGWISDNNTACWPSTDTTSPFWMVDDQVGLRWSGSFEAAYWINSPDKDTGRTELFNGQTFDHCPSIWATVVQITLFLFPSKCKWTGIEESGNHCHLLSAHLCVHYCYHRVFVLVVREMHCPTRSSMNFKKASDGPGRDGNSGYLYICHKSNRSLGAFGDGVSDQMYNESFFFCAYEAKAGLECAFCDLCFFRIKAWWWKESVNFFHLIMMHTQKFWACFLDEIAAKKYFILELLMNVRRTRHPSSFSPHFSRI